MHPADPATLAQPLITPGAWRPLSLTAGIGDPRLIGVVNDPRAFARDYDGSDMGEVAMPPGPPADEILGVYRLDEFDPLTPASQPAAFNYWVPAAAGGTAQLVTDTTVNPHTSRLTGLRLGLGRGVAVVVVASYAGRGPGDRLPADTAHGFRRRRAARQRRYASRPERRTLVVGGRRGRLTQLRRRSGRRRRQPVRPIRPVQPASVRARITLSDTGRSTHD